MWTIRIGPCAKRKNLDLPTREQGSRRFRSIPRVDRNGKLLHLLAMLDFDSLKIFLEREKPAALEFLRQMVGINSWTLNPEGVNRLAKFTAENFAPLGFTAEF